MKKQQGFSLVELMIVVAIIGALSALAIPAYSNYVKKSEATAGLATLKSLQTNAQIVEQETGTFPTTLEQIGASKTMNGLGEISITAAKTELVFTFGTDTSLNGLVLTSVYSNTGWICTGAGSSASGDLTLDGCKITKTA